MQFFEIRFFLVPKSRKRIRRIHSHKRNLDKENVEHGRFHITKSGKNIPEKTFKPQNICKCSKLCATKIDETQQRHIFDTYYKQCNWTQKTLFIRSCVKTKNVQTKKSQLYPIIAAKNREKTCVYFLIDDHDISQTVCRDFFMNCIQVTSGRIHPAINTARKNPSAKERRGTQPSANKTKEEDKLAVRQFIESIPAYESHYGRSSTEKKYLNPNLNIITLYREYESVMRFRQRNPVSLHIFRTIFNTEFNLAFKRRHTDTCRTCDEYKIQISSLMIVNQQKERIKAEKEAHLDMVRITNEAFKKDVQDASDSSLETMVLTFDLQKTLETPSITTGVAFYKRVLWTYNLCVYDEVQKTGLLRYFFEDVNI